MIFAPLVSGSSGNCTYVEAGDVRLLIDAGPSARRICGLLREIGVEPSSIGAILITHEHTDHIGGVAVFSKQYGIPVYANAETHDAMLLKKAEIPPALVRVIEPDRVFFIRQARILPFSTQHDSARSMGYSVMHAGCKCTVMTDTGRVTERMLEAASGSDVILIEANHDVEMLKCGPYPAMLKHRILSARGHLSNEDCGTALCRLHETGVTNAVLGHLSQENNTPELARVTVESILQEKGILGEMRIVVARRLEPTGVFRIGEDR